MEEVYADVGLLDKENLKNNQEFEFSTGNGQIIFDVCSIYKNNALNENFFYCFKRQCSLIRLTKLG